MESQRSFTGVAKKWIGNAFFLVGLVLVGVLLLFVLQSKISGRAPMIAGRQLYIVLGGSMSPTFEAGALAVIEPIDADVVEVGDILTYRGAGAESATTHRVVDIVEVDGSRKFVTRGDANDVDDPMLLEPNDIVGRVSFTVPYLGRLMNFAQSRLGLALLVIVPGIVLIIYEIRSMAVTLRQIRAEKKSVEQYEEKHNAEMQEQMNTE